VYVASWAFAGAEDLDVSCPSPLSLCNSSANDWQSLQQVRFVRRVLKTTGVVGTHRVPNLTPTPLPQKVAGHIVDPTRKGTVGRGSVLAIAAGRFFWAESLPGCALDLLIEDCQGRE
jgi:hypothetical protein